MTRQHANRRFQPPENVRASRENANFAVEVGEEGRVRAVGAGTQGQTPEGIRAVRAPAGVVEFEPSEMTARVGAGTAIADLQAALAEGGQRVLLPSWGPGSTVGGVLATGRSDLNRLGWGPIRDRVLELRYVDAAGRLVKAGGPTVKNVSGFDLCRLHVGANGTLGLLAEAVLRTHPLPATSAWWTGRTEPGPLRSLLHRPVAILWDGEQTWVRLEGHEGDVTAEGRRLVDRGLEPTDGPPALPTQRWSVDPVEVPGLAAAGAFGARFVAEVGVGTVHASEPQPVPPMATRLRRLNDQVRERFDPAGRFAAPADPVRGAA